MDHKEFDNPLLGQLPMFIIDVLQHDIAEQLDSILQLLNDKYCLGWREFWPHDFNESEVIPALAGLVTSGMVVIYCDDTDECGMFLTPLRELPHEVAKYWYGRSESGVAAWDAWDPPISDVNK
jgi:hypothetical protein